MLINSERTFNIATVSLGAATILTQLVILRIFFSVFNGNELVLGVILANWMLLTGAGSYLGKFMGINGKRAFITVFFLQLLCGILPVLTGLYAALFRTWLFPPGILLDVAGIMGISFVLLLPFCLVSGMLFTIYSVHFSRVLEKNIIGRAYAFESAGSIGIGLLFNFLLLFLLDTYQNLAVVLAINLIAIFSWVIHHNKRMLNLLVILPILLLAAVSYFLPAIKDIAERSLYHGQEIVYQKETPYGSLVVTETSGQYNFMVDRMTLFSTGQIIESEENAHYAMIQHPAPEDVLLLGGGVAGALQEVMKYDCEQVDYVEINPWLIKAGDSLTENLPDAEGISIHVKDGRLFLWKSKTPYDVILVNTPDPVNAQLNRYYTLEFFRMAKERMQDLGILSVSLASTGNYMGEEARDVQSVLFSTLAKVFGHVMIVPGNRNYFIASDRQLSYDITDMIAERGVPTQYVNQYYVDQNSLERRGKLITDQLQTDADINRDFRPVSYLMQLRYWLQMSGVKQGVIFLFGALILILALIIRLSKTGWGMLATGFTSSSLEVLLLIAFQIMFGYVYYMTGIIITVFMAGLFTGSYYIQRQVRIRFGTFRTLQAGMGTMALLVAFVLYIFRVSGPHPVVLHAGILILTFVTACLAGTQFAVAAKIRQESTRNIAAVTYSADLAGSAAGALLVSTFAIPALGLFQVCFMLGIMNLAVFALFFHRQDRF